MRQRRVAVLTGATGGIGQAVAQAFDTLGYKLILIGRSQRKLAALERRLGGEHLTLAGDLSLVGKNRRLGSEIRAIHDQIDLLLNVAGIISRERRTTSEGHELTLATNLLGPIALTQALSPTRTLMTGSQAIMFARDLSADGLGKQEPYSGFGAYAHSKAYLTHWSLTRERALGVHVVDPGPTDTAMARDPAVPLLLRLAHPIVKHSTEVAARAFTRAATGLTGEQMRPAIVNPRGSKTPPEKYFDQESSVQLSTAIDRLMGG